MPSANERLRILGWPAFKSRRENPYNWMLYSAIGNLGHEVEEFSIRRLLFARPDVWHFHWPERFLREGGAAKTWVKSAMLLALVWFARLRRTRVVWTVHNVHPHEAVDARLSRWFYARLSRGVDVCIHFTADGMSAALATHPSLSSALNVVIPHGYYSDLLLDRASKGDARTALGIPVTAQLIVFFGQIRPYKDVPALVRAFCDLKGTNILLYVAGLPGSHQDAESVREAAGGDGRVRTMLRLLDEPELFKLIAASDLVVLPYKETLNADNLNSGSAILALSAGRPVLVPLRGAIVDLATQVGDDWIRGYSGALTSRTLADALEWARSSPRAATPDLGESDWSAIAQRTVQAYDNRRDDDGSGHHGMKTK